MKKNNKKKKMKGKGNRRTSVRRWRGSERLHLGQVKRKFDCFESSQAMSTRPSDQPTNSFATKYRIEK
jgi:hypothetical protein